MSKDINKRIAISSDFNQKYFNEFSESLDASNQVLKNHRSTVINLIEFFNHQPLNKISLEAIHEYLKTIPNPNTYNTKAENLKKFFLFLESHVLLQFSSSDIDSLKYNTKVVRETTSKPHPLTFEDIIKLRTMLKNLEKYDLLLTFELCYQLGEQKFENIPLYHSLSYQPEHKAFLIKKKLVPIPPSIEELIEKNALPKSNMSKENFYNKIKEIEKLLGRKIEWRDILETRKLNFFVCPKCQNLFENKPENWVVYEYQEDGSRWIVCKAVCYYEVYNARN